MAQQTCCVSSRPASRLVDRSLFRSSSKSRISKRLGRIARRALAALLIVGGTSFSVSNVPALAHDHVPAVDESAPVDVAANPLPSRLTDEAMLGQWLSSIEAAEAVCGPAREMIDEENVDTKIELSAGPLAANQQVVVGGGGVHSVQPTTASQWQEYCKLQNLLAWGDQARQWASPMIRAIDQSAKEMAQADAATAVSQERELVRGLSDLSCEEPIDITSQAVQSDQETEDCVAAQTIVEDAQIDNSSDSPKFASVAMIGSGPVVTTIEDAYLAYDLSPEDVIAMRMYPIDGPTATGAPISYLGARRTAIYGPVPNFEASGNWHQQVEPGIVVSTPGAEAPAVEVASAEPVPAPGVTEPQTQLPESVVQAISKAALAVVAAVQPDSEARQFASAATLSLRVGEVAGEGIASADRAVGQFATRLAAAIPVQPQPRPFLGPAEQLVAEAKLEAPRAVAEMPQLLQIELACKTALDVVKQQAARGEASDMPVAEIAATIETKPADELVRAQAVATACDLAAESLEKLAMSLRRAGDSLVRQAKAGNGANRSLLR